MSAIRENGATSGVGVLATYTYDNLGRRTGLTRGNGTSSTYSYDAVSRLSSLSEDISGTTYDQTLGFSYNPANHMTQTSRSNDNYAWGGHYNVNTSYTENGLNQYNAVGSITPTYDSKGNLTSAGATTYGYSSENLLTSASGGIALTYDPALRLYQLLGGSPGTQRFAYDGVNLIAEYNSSNAMLRRYVHGPGTDEPIVWYEGSGTTDRRFLHADERGSIVAVTSSSGSALSINSYDEYGLPASSNAGRFQYTGQAWIPELGVYYYKARMYASGLGRFMQTDPIGYGDGLNLYAYVHANPLNNADPFGLCDGKGKTQEERDAQCGSGEVNEIVVQAISSHGGIGGGSSGFSGGGGLNLDSTPGLTNNIVVTMLKSHPINDGKSSNGDDSTIDTGEIVVTMLPTHMIQVAANQGRGRRGPISTCPGLGGQECGAPVAAGGTNPNHPNVCPQCLDREKKWPYGGPPPESLKNIPPALLLLLIILAITIIPKPIPE